MCTKQISPNFLPLSKFVSRPVSRILQPSDVASFNRLKKAYHNQWERHLLNPSSTSLSKGLFFRWHQEAWKETAVKRESLSGWSESGLWPLSRAAMGLKTRTTTLPLLLPPKLWLPPHGAFVYRVAMLVRCDKADFRRGGETTSDRAVEEPGRGCDVAERARGEERGSRPQQSHPRQVWDGSLSSGRIFRSNLPEGTRRRAGRASGKGERD